MGNSPRWFRRVFTLLNAMKSMFLYTLQVKIFFFFSKLYFLLMLLNVKGTFLQKRGGNHYYPNTIHLKFFHPHYQNGILSGKFSIPLDLSNGFLYRVIRHLKISVLKNHPVKEKWWFWLTASLLQVEYRICPSYSQVWGNQQRKEP